MVPPIVRDAASSEAKINEQREAEFVRDRNRQRDLLAAARQELAAENARSDRLRDEYDVNERALAEQPDMEDAAYNKAQIEKLLQQQKDQQQEQIE